MQSIEIWKDIDFTKGRYQVSNVGNVRRLGYNMIKSNGAVMHLKPMHMKQHEDPDGYLTVGFTCKDIGIYKTCMVHRLVASAFIPNTENKPTVNHKDGNKKNNRIDNLEWATYQEQSDHAHRIGLRPHNMYVEIGRKASKVVSIPVICTNTGERFKSMSDAEHKYGLYGGAVSICISTGNPVHGLYFEKITKD